MSEFSMFQVHYQQRLHVRLDSNTDTNISPAMVMKWFHCSRPVHLIVHKTWTIPATLYLYSCQFIYRCVWTGEYRCCYFPALTWLPAPTAPLLCLSVRCAGLISKEPSLPYSDPHRNTVFPLIFQWFIQYNSNAAIDIRVWEGKTTQSCSLSHSEVAVIRTLFALRTDHTDSDSLRIAAGHPSLLLSVCVQVILNQQKWTNIG